MPAVREIVEQQGIRALIGEYRSRCLFSKAWILREAVLTKVHMMLNVSVFECYGRLLIHTMLCLLRDSRAVVAVAG